MRAVVEKIRKYYKNVIVETDYIRPNITSNGTLGGDTFACASNNFPWSNTGECYHMFDGVDGSFNGNGTNHNGGGWIKWYNPKPLKISNVICAAGYSGDWFDVTFRGSDDGTNWTDVAYFNHGVRQNCPVNSPDFYKYWMMYNNSGFGHDGNGYGGGISEIHITGIERVESIEESTESDYDFYKDTKEIKCIKEIDRSYYKRIVTEFEQPVLSSNGIMGGNSFAVSGSGTAWYGFDSNEDSCLGQVGTLWFTFYTPEAINLTMLGIRNAGSTYLNFVSGGTIYGSDDNSTWTTLKSFSNSNTSYTWWYVDLSDNTKEFKYHKFVSSGSFGGNSNYLGGVRITGTHTDIVQILNPQFIERKYYKYTYESWSQPVFTSATTWGNVSADNYSTGSSQLPFHALDGKTSGGDEADFAANNGTTVNWYWTFAEPLKITNIKIWNRNNAGSYGGATTYTVYGLNNDDSYTQIGTISVGATGWASSETFIDNSNMFNGLKIYCSGSKSYVGIGEILLTAFTQSIVEGTEQDYDWYEDIYNYDFYKDITTYYTLKS